MNKRTRTILAYHLAAHVFVARRVGIAFGPVSIDAPGGPDAWGGGHLIDPWVTPERVRDLVTVLLAGTYGEGPVLRSHAFCGDGDLDTRVAALVAMKTGLSEPQATALVWELAAAVKDVVTDAYRAGTLRAIALELLDGGTLATAPESGPRGAHADSESRSNET